MAILIPKILRYSFKQAHRREAQCRQAQGRLCSGPPLSLRHAHLIEILRLSGYFIQLLRYTAGARCSMYYSTTPLGRDCKPCIRIKSLTQKGKGGGRQGKIKYQKSKCKIVESLRDGVLYVVWVPCSEPEGVGSRG